METLTELVEKRAEFASVGSDQKLKLGLLRSDVITSFEDILG